MKHSSDNSSEETVAAARLSVTMSIHQGKREHQEDACEHWFDPDSGRLFAVVADGAGGHGGGEEAAQAAIASSAKFWKQSSATTFEDPDAFLTEWMRQAHDAVNEAAAKVHRSARAVVVACVTDSRSAHWVHAGDCRLLRFHQRKLVERTRDDSVVQVLFERGDITEEEMGTHPDQSRLLQSLGGGDAPTPRLGRSALEAGDTLILCSDGFWEHLKTTELEKLAVVPPAKRQQTLDLAVKEAVRRAGAKADNTTAIMIHHDGGEGSGAFSPSARRAILWLLLSAALAAVAAWWVTEKKAWMGNPFRSLQDRGETRNNPAPAAEETPADEDPVSYEASKTAAETQLPQPKPNDSNE